MSSASVIVLAAGSSAAEREESLRAARERNPGAVMAQGDGWAAIVVGDGGAEGFEGLPGAERVVEVTAPYRLASREVLGGDSAVRVRRGSEPGVEVGGGAPLVVAVSPAGTSEAEERLRETAARVREAGGSLLHAGELVWEEEPSSAGLDALRSARRVADDVGLALCVEVSDHRQIEEASAHADVLQVGWRNMQDFALLRELGRAERPVLLKRGLSATVEEFLLAAEYVLTHGNGRVILCESGIRTFDAGGRPRFEINAIPVIKRATHLPLLADPSRATPRPELVPAVARAAVAAGVDGLVLDVGEGDAEGSPIAMEAFLALMDELPPIAEAVGRRL